MCYASKQASVLCRDTVMYGTTGYSSECSSIMRLLSEAVFKPNITDNEVSADFYLLCDHLMGEICLC